MKHTLNPWDRGFILRPWREEDGAAMASLHRRTIFATSNEHYTEEQRKSWAIGLSAETYKKSAANGEIYLVAVNEDDQPLAFCGYKGNEICGLYVDPSHQNRGIGQRLLFRAFVNMHQSQPEKNHIVGKLTGKSVLRETWL